MKIVSTLLLALLVPQAFMGILTVPYDYGDYTNDSMDTQTIVVNTSVAPEIEKESWLLDIQWPVDDYTKTTSHYGYRWLSNCRACSTFHQGVDFVPGEGSNVYNIMDGEIVDVGWDGGYGYRVVIEHVIHPDELVYKTIYAHLQESLISSRYHAGDTVSKGDLIGIVGNTGVSTGPHLHFEVHRNERVLDPLAFFHKNIPSLD